MLGRKERDQRELFISGSLRRLIADDHVLVRVDAVLDLSRLRADLVALSCADNGRPDIDPEVAVRLMLAGFLFGIVHDRRLMREARVHIATRWFIGYGLHEGLPDHSSLTRIRQRWGAERFRRIFERPVQACVAAKIARGELVHIDASLIRAPVSWDALAVRHVEAVAQGDDEALPNGRRSGKFKKVCVSDPDATMATNGRNRRLDPADKHHTAVDDGAGVVVASKGRGARGTRAWRSPHVSRRSPPRPGARSAWRQWMRAMPTPRSSGRWKIETWKASRPPRPNRRQARSSLRGGSRSSLATLSHAARKEKSRAPRGPRGKPHRGFQSFHASARARASARECRGCPFRARCLGPSRHARLVVFNVNPPSLLRARGKRLNWRKRDNRLYQRHRWRVEGVHGQAKTWRGLARAVRRGLDNRPIQAFLTAATITLKRLAAACLALMVPLLPLSTPSTGAKTLHCA